MPEVEDNNTGNAILFVTFYIFRAITFSIQRF